MYVGLKMLKDFVTVTPETLIKEADKILEDNQLWMLLVKEGEELVGYVTKEDVRAALPSVINSLDKHELSYLLSKITVREVVRKNITTIPPETDIEAAADLMFEMNLSGLAVVNENKKLIGYINRNKMLELLVEEMGLKHGGSRIVVDVEERSGVIYEVAGIISNMKYSIISTGVFHHNNRRMVVVRVDTEDASPIVAAIKERGYKVVGPEDFMDEWKS
ncbi:CBS domain-containing protein [Maridesulfovibrio hydrothermalis]|uniref:CBS domain containing protein n=1 Tax=Maridesulfovibrio hydrothermalis AM13 = DSM 14728 TaxID=1121451 RepID=L0RAI0_9BACT|nr:CBS domain-containing protein [Maridesulfovibrio hydrothermalis]CCO22571.1 CBS domain containing protein [Maridesulfovibrio hydrothermalis AM13 = DSM 14728]